MEQTARPGRPTPSDTSMEDGIDSYSRAEEAPDRLLLGLLIVVAFVARIVFVADFPLVQADEGLWTNSTKNFLLFGDWFMDERSHLFLSPVFHFLSLPSFLLLGPSIEAARLVSVCAGTAAVPLVYLLGLRLTQDRWSALLAAAVMALDPWALTHSRQAMTESVLLLFILAAGVMVLGRRREVALGGILLALAILTKLNAAAMGIALGGYLLLRPVPYSASSPWRARFVDGALFGLVALGLAALGYWAIAQIDPDRFVEVFRRELGGEHLRTPGESPGPGRFALSPVFAGRNILELVRLNPILVPFGALGAVVVGAARAPARLFLGLWLVVALGFPLTQIYQPIRYFFPAMPALALLVGILVAHLRRGGPAGRRIMVGAMVVILGFNSAYLVMNFAANRGSTAVAVERWARENTHPDEPLLAAAFLATNPPNRVYAYDILARNEELLTRAVDSLGIRYVIWDEAEWSQQMREVLERRYTLVHEWTFGAVYRVDGDLPAPRRPAPGLPARPAD
jgi:4-amino-4-deoxy-L-arabinose transferase-like glycosyltransferase